MPAGISNDALLDLTRTTLENLPNLEFETALNYQSYPVCNRWFKADRVQVGSGYDIRRNIVLDTSGNARHVRLYQKTPVNATDVHKQIVAPWCQVQTHWSVERRELLRNRAPAKYIDLLQTRRLDGTLDLADLLEERAWATPSSSTDDLNPMGLPYWLSMRQDGITDATDNGAFACYTIRYPGGTNGTTKGGLDGSLSANAKWRNWGAVYTSINEAFCNLMRKAFHATRFVSPIMVSDLKDGPASAFRIYMPLDELVAYEALATSANDNLGPDLLKYHGLTAFKGIPCEYCPQLDGFEAIGGNDTVNTPAPIYAVNHSKFYPFVQEGDWMREDGPYSDVEQHNVQTTFIDGSYNFFAKNVREAGFVLHTALTA